MMRARTLISTAVFALTTAYGVAAQSGVADLRYVFPLPTSVVFTAVDTMETTISGMPTGDSKMNTTTSSVSEIQFAPGDSGIAVTAALRSFRGVMSTAMGDLTLKSPEVTPIQFRIGATGASASRVASEFGTTDPSAAPEESLAKARALSGLFTLPGRTMQLGESWSDTMRVSREHEGMQFDFLTIISGTYVADSVVSGRTLNVLRVINESKMSGAGTYQGMDIVQTTTSKSEDLVLWDSDRHIPVSRDALTHIDTETGLQQMNITTRMNARTRMVITAEAQN